MNCPKCKKLLKSTKNRIGGFSFTSLKCVNCPHELVPADVAGKVAEFRKRQADRLAESQAEVPIRKLGKSWGLRVPKDLLKKAGFKHGQTVLVKREKQGLSITRKT